MSNDPNVKPSLTNNVVLFPGVHKVRVTPSEEELRKLRIKALGRSRKALHEYPHVFTVHWDPADFDGKFEINTTASTATGRERADVVYMLEYLKQYLVDDWRRQGMFDE